VDSLRRQLGSIRFRILFAFVVALSPLLGALGYLFVQQGTVQESLSVIIEEYLPLSKSVAGLQGYIQRVNRDITRLNRDEARPGTGSAAPAVIYADEFRESLGIGRIHVSAMLRLGHPPEEQAALVKMQTYMDEIGELFAEYEQLKEKFFRLAEADRMEEARDLRDPLRRVSHKLTEEIEQLERTLDERILVRTKATEQSQLRAMAIAGGLSVLAFSLSFALVGAVLLALRPIGKLTQQIQRLAAGDYGGRVEVEGVNEVGVLAAEVNAMADAIELRDRTLVERAEELRRVSGYLGSVLDSLEDALMVFEGGEVTLVNPAAERDWGARRGEEAPAALRELLASPGHHVLEREDGAILDVRIMPFGQQGVLVVVADVTEQARAKERLARSERLALIGQMLAQITHEVRNPLNALSLNAEMLGDELVGLDPERRTESWEILDVVAGEIERLTAVTGHYLQLARRPPAEREPTDLGTVVEDIARLLELELQQQEVTLKVSQVPVPAFELDPSQVKQALLNVVRNAVEAGARRLELTVRHRGHQVEVELRDDGPGMTPEEVQRACDPFFSTKVAGTGLGLAITRQIMDDHDGGLEVSSEMGQGTRILLVFPVRALVGGTDGPDNPGRR
jgi:signal transduction histidine kinase/HAMP domain-containing protein